MESTSLRVLIVEDRPDDAELVLRELRRGGYKVEWQRVETPEAFDAALTPDLDIILSDFVMPRFNGMQALLRRNESGYDIPFILISGTIGEDQAVEAMRNGATDYLLKDRLMRLGAAVRQALEQKALRRGAAQAELAARQSAVRFQALIENSAEGVWLVDSRATITYASPATERLLGYPVAEIVGRDGFGLLHPAEANTMRAVFARTLSGANAIVSSRARLLHKSGQWRWIEATSNNLLADPDVGAIVINFRDISDRVQRERELEAIASISQALRLAQTRAAMLPIILDQVTALLHAGGTSIDLRQPHSDHIVIEAAHGDWAAFQGQRLDGPPRVDAEVMQTGRVYVHPDVAQEPRYFKQAITPNTTAVACLPLKVREVPIGTLWIGRATPIADEEVRLLLAVADIAASAIQRVTLHEQTEVQLQRLSTLRTIDIAINASLDLNVTLNVLITQATQQLGVHAALILLYEPHTQQLAFAAARGFRTHVVDNLRLRLGEGLAGAVAANRQTRVVDNLASLPAGLVHSEMLAAEDFVAFVGVPLIAKGQLKGVFEIFHRAPLSNDQEWVEFLETLAGQTAIAIDNATVYADLQRSHSDLRLAYDSTLEGWSRALDLRDHETEGHTQRVTELSVRLGRAMGLTPDELVLMRRGALLHDIGKLGVPDAILHKPGKLDDAEWVLMRRHPEYAYQMLLPIAYLHRALDVPHYHHEKWDGTGYPDRLAGTNIPLAARIFTVADVYDALRSDRPYRPGWSEAETREYIYAQAGVSFDPEVVKAFRQLMTTG